MKANSSVFILGLGIALITGSALYAQDVCTGFSGGTLGDQNIQQEFAPAVFEVGDVGTAYLVDSENGYLLTDNHVINNLSGALELVSGDKPYNRYSFRVVKQFQMPDIALLQLNTPGALKGIRALDIASVPPDFDSSLSVIGYPHYGSAAQVFRRGGSGIKFAGYTPSGFIEINHLTVPGNSGGPLIDNYGYVVGTSEEDIQEGQVGRYLPVREMLPLLESIPVTARMRKLEADLVGGKLDSDGLRQMLKKTASSPTNLELLVWLNDVKQRQASLKALSKYLDCPVLDAVTERHIPDAIRPFIALLSSASAGRAQITLAQADYRLFLDGQAAQLASNSAEALGAAGVKAPKDKQTALLLLAAINAQKQLGTTVRHETATIKVTLDSGNIERYQVQWAGVVNSNKTEQGQRFPFFDTRKCQWEIQTDVVRQIYHLDADEKVVDIDNFTHLFKTDFTNNGSNVLFTNLLPLNCGDAAPRYDIDVQEATDAVRNTFLNIVPLDQKNVLSDILTLPHVKAASFETK